MLNMDIESVLKNNKGTKIQWKVKEASKSKVQDFMRKYDIQFMALFDELSKAIEDYEAQKKKRK